MRDGATVGDHLNRSSLTYSAPGVNQNANIEGNPHFWETCTNGWTRSAATGYALAYPCDRKWTPVTQNRFEPRQRTDSMRVGYAAGGFDLFHVGHLNILRQARSQCDYLIAGVVSDEMLELTKGARPVVPLNERLEIVRHISFVDEAVPEVLLDKMDTWRELQFNVFFKGDDWRGTERGLQLEKEFATVDVDVVYFPYTMHTSSTALRLALEALSRPAPVMRDRQSGAQN